MTILLDYPTSAWFMKKFSGAMMPVMSNSQAPVKGSISSTFLSKTKTSAESVEFGQVIKASRGYLTPLQHKEWCDFMSEFKAPKKFVAMGSICSHYFTGATLKFSAGRVFKWKHPVNLTTHEVFVTHHPSGVLGNKYIENSFMADLKKIESFIQNDTSVLENANSCDIFIHDDETSIIDHLSKHNVIAVDIETSGHSGNRTIDCISFSPSEKESHVLLHPNQDQIKLICEEKTCVFHQSVYDCSYIESSKYFNIEDTILMARSENPMELSGLNELSKKYTPNWQSWKNFRED